MLLLASSLVGTTAQAQPTMHARVRLLITGNSRFATELVGRDTVLAHLAALHLLPDARHECEGPFILGPGELVWLARPTLPSSPEVAPALVLVTTDSAGAATAFTVLFDDEEQLARRFPRDDGIVRTSLAEKRNRLAVARLHGQSAPPAILTANRERVFVTVPPLAPVPGTGRRAWRLVAYTFDATGAVRSVVASPPHTFSPLSLIR